MAGRLTAVLAVLLFAAACAETQLAVHTAKRIGRTAEAPAPAGNYKVGNPYQIKGVWYHPAEDFDYDDTGIASWYGPKFHGKRTANGEIFDMNELSAAHKTLPMPSFVRVTNLENGRSLLLRVNDRGPFAHGRIIDVSRRAAQLLGFERQGTARVRVTIDRERSVATARALTGGAQLAAADSPIIVDRLPKAAVSSQTLPPPPGGAAAEAPVAAATPAPAETKTVAALPQVVDVQPLQAAPDTLTVQPVAPSSIFIQVGAFSRFDNANRVAARLSGLPDVRIMPVLIEGRDLFRVRIGPMAAVEMADTRLEQVIAAGFEGARIIID